ncbi:MAG: Hsp20/alpha crystallin family protein [Patescibacteria group bacterium]|nr:Hsp20/alpha crystallin family protein [Patescibacteria group bacterium]
MLKKKSFLQRITGGIRFDDDEKDEESFSLPDIKKDGLSSLNKEMLDEDEKKDSKFEEEEDAQLTIDLYQTPTDIIIQTMIAGVVPDNLSITITRDMITIRGKREENRSINTENYFVQELYWGSFSRVVSLPEEVDPEEAEAVEKHGLLIIKLPKINKDKKTVLKIKSI